MKSKPLMRVVWVISCIGSRIKGRGKRERENEHPQASQWPMWAEKKSEERGRIEGMGNGVGSVFIAQGKQMGTDRIQNIFKSDQQRHCGVGDPKEPLGAVDDRGHM